MAKTRVRQSTIDEIRQLGMAKSLAKANSGNASPEFQEAVKRYFPNAKFGPKTAAAANAPSATAKGASDASDQEITRVAKKSFVAPKAVARRVEGAERGKPGYKTPGEKIGDFVSKGGIGNVFKGKPLGARVGDWINSEKKKNPPLATQLGLGRGQKPLGAKIGDKVGNVRNPLQSASPERRDAFKKKQRTAAANLRKKGYNVRG